MRNRRMSRQILVTVTVRERTIEIYRFTDTSGPKHGWFEAVVKPPPAGHSIPFRKVLELESLLAPEEVEAIAKALSAVPKRE